MAWVFYMALIQEAKTILSLCDSCFLTGLLIIVVVLLQLCQRQLFLPHNSTGSYGVENLITYVGQSRDDIKT